jgi:hypothetical protein
MFPNRLSKPAELPVTKPSRLSYKLPTLFGISPGKTPQLIRAEIRISYN